MSYDIEHSILIDAPPEEVWRWVAEDVDLERSWRNLDGRGVQSLERLDDGPIEVGSRFRGTVKMGAGEPQAYTNVVTQIVDQRSIAWETTEAEGHLSGRGNYELESVDGKTRFHIRLDYPPQTFVGKLQRPIVRLLGGRFVGNMVRKLKESIEAGASD